MNPLTQKELQIVALVTDGLKNREVAREIGITVHVVKNRMRLIYEKLGFHNRVEVALWYVKQMEGCPW